MKTYTGKCPINRGNGDLICKGINTLNILDTVLVSMMAPQLLEWNQLMYLRCMMTVGAQVSHPHHSDLLPLSVYEAVAFPAFSCQTDWSHAVMRWLQITDEWILIPLSWWCTVPQVIVCWLQGCTFTEEDYLWLPWQLFLFDPVHASFKRDVQSPPIENSDVNLNPCYLSVQHNNQPFP